MAEDDDLLERMARVRAGYSVAAELPPRIEGPILPVDIMIERAIERAINAPG